MDDWDDHQGWNSFHAEDYQKEGHRLSGAEFMFLDSLLQIVIEKKFRNIWFPGCGISVVPKVFSKLGFNVWATDVSDVAISIQQEFFLKSVEQLYSCHIEVQNDQDEWEVKNSIVDHLIDNYPTLHSVRDKGTLKIDKHDFRTPFQYKAFDCIVNMRAFQGFSNTSQKQIAKVYYDALQAGGWAVFSTQNVVGKSKLELQASLLDARFHVENFKINSWFWNTLIEILPPDLAYSYAVFEDSFWSDSDRKKYKKTLEGLKQEYKQRVKQESEETKDLLNDGETKVAKVFSYTG